MPKSTICALDFSGERWLCMPMQADGPCTWVDPSSCERWQSDLDAFAARALRVPTIPGHVRNVHIIECDGGVLVSFQLPFELPKPTSEFPCTP